MKSWRWYLPTRYELRHPLKWIHRLRHWQVTFQFDTYSATLVDQVNAFLSENLPPVVDPTAFRPNERIDDAGNSLLSGAVDFQFYMIPDRQNTGYRFQRDYIVPRRPVGMNHMFGPWERTCVRSECCDAPVYMRHSFVQMRSYHWCPQCETCLFSVDSEAIWHMEDPSFDPSTVDSTMPPTT